MNEVQSPESDGWYSNDAATFGDRVAGARDTLGISQSDLSRKLGIKLKTLQAWEDDISEPRANKLQMLAGVLNVSLMWLLSGEGEGVAAPEDRAALPADVHDLLAEVRLIQGQLAETAARLGQAEKRLRRALRESA